MSLRVLQGPDLLHRLDYTYVVIVEIGETSKSGSADDLPKELQHLRDDGTIFTHNCIIKNNTAEPPINGEINKYFI